MVPPLFLAGTNSTLISIAVDNALDVMGAFGLERDDFDVVCSLSVPGTDPCEEDPTAAQISKQALSALTRKFTARFGGNHTPDIVHVTYDRKDSAAKKKASLIKEVVAMEETSAAEGKGEESQSGSGDSAASIHDDVDGAAMLGMMS